MHALRYTTQILPAAGSVTQTEISSPIELFAGLTAALDGHREALGLRGKAAPPPLREELEEMMARFPD